MPEIDIQRRTAPAVPVWLWMIGGLLAAGLLWWLIAESTDRDRVAQAPATERVAGERQETPQMGETAFIPIAAIKANPDAQFGQSVSGLANVVEVVSERAFWVEQDGNRIMVVRDENLQGVPEIVTGQRLSLQAAVSDSRTMEQMPSVMKLPEETRRLLQGETVFLHATDIQIQNT